MRKVLRQFRRPRWLVATACLAVAAPAVFFASGVATGGTTKGVTASPVVNRDYLYGQLFDLAYNNVYRISGADGDPRNPSDPFNVAPTLNGWQEFFQQWKSELTNEKSMTKLAKFATVSDHYFRRMPEQRTNANYTFDPSYRWDSNDAEVTIPGATCAGQRVLLAAHPDLTPVSPTIVGEINNPTGSTSAVNGFGAARRHLTLSNLENGGAYDDTSGVAMTMAEYRALLEWYEANKTYPAKTLKVALLDASAGRAKDGTYLREGSKYYAKNLIPKGPQGQYAMFAVMNANGASYPAYHFGTKYYWNDINAANGGVGPWHTFITDTPSTANTLYPDTGPGSPGANIAANSAAIAAFHGDLTNAVTAGFTAQSEKYSGLIKQENPLRYNGTGSAPGGLSAANGGPQEPQTPTVASYTASDQATYSPVNPAGTAPEAQILSTEDDAAAFWSLGIPGFSVGGVQDTNIVENPYPATTSAAIRATPVLQHLGGTSLQMGSGTGSAGMTTAAAATAVGDTNVKVASVTNLVAGQPLMIDTGQNLEVGQIVAVGTAGAAGTGVTVAAPLRFAHASGVPFRVNEGQPVGMTGDSVEHLNMWASGAPHGLADESEPTEALLRALELPSTYTALLAAGDKYLGAVDREKGAVAYFETNPVNPTGTRTVTFDAGFSRADNGDSKGLKYYWDFGDGTFAVGEKVTHTFASSMWADVKLVVAKGDQKEWAAYRQAVAVDSPSGAAPSTPPCGTLSAAERDALFADAKDRLKDKP